MQSQNFYKPFSWVMIVVVLLLSGTLLYFITTQKEFVINPLTEKELAEIPIYSPKPKGGPVNPKLAYDMIRQYHLKGRTVIVTTEKKLGLLHDSSSLNKYVNVIFPKFCQEHPVANTAYKDYEWEIGFYYSLSRGKEPNSPRLRLNVCLIPTLVNNSLELTDSKRVIDFYIAFNNSLYPDVYPIPQKGKQTSDDYIYDTGEIWP